MSGTSQVSIPNQRHRSFQPWNQANQKRTIPLIGYSSDKLERKYGIDPVLQCHFATALCLDSALRIFGSCSGPVLGLFWGPFLVFCVDASKPSNLDLHRPRRLVLIESSKHGKKATSHRIKS